MPRLDSHPCIWSTASTLQLCVSEGRNHFAKHSLRPEGQSLLHTAWQHHDAGSASASACPHLPAWPAAPPRWAARGRGPPWPRPAAPSTAPTAWLPRCRPALTRAGQAAGNQATPVMCWSRGCVWRRGRGAVANYVDCCGGARCAQQICSAIFVKQQKFDDCPDEGSGAGASRGCCWASIASVRCNSGIDCLMSASMHAHGVRSPVASAARLPSGQRCTGMASSYLTCARDQASLSHIFGLRGSLIMCWNSRSACWSLQYVLATSPPPALARTRRWLQLLPQHPRLGSWQRPHTLQRRSVTASRRAAPGPRPSCGVRPAQRRAFRSIAGRCWPAQPHWRRPSASRRGRRRRPTRSSPQSGRRCEARAAGCVWHSINCWLIKTPRLSMPCNLLKAAVLVCCHHSPAHAAISLVPRTRQVHRHAAREPLRWSWGDECGCALAGGSAHRPRCGAPGHRLHRSRPEPRCGAELAQFLPLPTPSPCPQPYAELCQITASALGQKQLLHVQGSCWAAGRRCWRRSTAARRGRPGTWRCVTRPHSTVAQVLDRLYLAQTLEQQAHDFAA